MNNDDVVPPFAEPASKQNSWVSVNERTPEQYMRSYLVFVPHNRCSFTAYLDIDRDTGEEDWFHFQSGDRLERPVSHWMTLPESPN